MEGRFDDDDTGRSRPWRGLGPAALLLPVFSALFVGLWITDAGTRTSAPATEAHADEEGALSVRVGTTVLPSGSRVDVRLSTMQTESQRQSFDREALARRFGLGTGEAWRLEVRFGASTAPSRERLRFEAIEVVDRDGRAARRLERDSTGPVDPLLVLFEPPAEVELAVGEALQFVLWGRESGGAARLVGLELDGVDFEVPLTPLELREAELPASVARGPRRAGER